MKDLKVTGEEPEWFRKDLLDTVTDMKDDSLAGLKKEYSKLKKEKQILASEIQRT